MPSPGRATMRVTSFTDRQFADRALLAAVPHGVLAVLGELVEGGEDLVRQPSAVLVALRLRGDAEDDLVGVDLLEPHVRVRARGGRDRLLEQVLDARGLDPGTNPRDEVHGR